MFSSDTSLVLNIGHGVLTEDIAPEKVWVAEASNIEKLRNASDLVISSFWVSASSAEGEIWFSFLVTNPRIRSRCRMRVWTIC
jgi:hypothetical protein